VIRHFTSSAAEHTQFTPWAVAEAVCAQITIYYKETAFLLVVGFAVGRLILRCRRRAWLNGPTGPHPPEPPDDSPADGLARSSPCSGSGFLWG
jgi:hypothetical protein